MASSIAAAQDVMLCELCNEVPLQLHCNKCAISLCKGCMADHLISDTTKAHEVVTYKMRNEDPVFPHCKTHSHQKCEMYCHECDIPLCVKCVISGSHINHQSKVTGITDLFNSKKENLRQKSEELENSIYPKYENNISELESLISRLPESYEKLMPAISKQGEAWHREIDIIINKIKQEVEKMKNKDLTTLNKNLTEMKNLLSTIYQAIMNIQKILKSNNISEIMTAVPDIPEFTPPKNLDVNPPTFVPSPIQGEQLHHLFGTLIASSISETLISPTVDAISQPNKQILNLPKEAKSMDTGTKRLIGVECPSPNEVWVSAVNSDKIQHFHMDGSLQQTVTTTTGKYPNGITITPQGELVYTDWEDRSINILSNGKPCKNIIKIKEWIPGQVCSTASGDILVALKKDNKTCPKVVRYSGSTERQVIQFDQDGNPWFSTGGNTLYITENGNGDLCASDLKAKQVMVIKQAGQLRFRYTGNLFSGKYTSFHPWGIATDILNQVLVADKGNKCIHIIRHDGHFIRYTDNCQLTDPADLSINGNFLFVAEFDTGKVKKIQYLK